MNRTKDGSLQADPKRFPSGIKKLADYVSKPIYRGFIILFRACLAHLQSSPKEQATSTE